MSSYLQYIWSQKNSSKSISTEFKRLQGEDQAKLVFYQNKFRLSILCMLRNKIELKKIYTENSWNIKDGY